MKKEIFLTSFPRSGNTWMRFLIANIYNNLESKFSEVDFHNIHEIVPEYGAKEEPVFAQYPNVYKTHARFEARFKHTVLLLRNPCDALFSYWNYLTDNNGLSMSLKDVISHEKYGVRAIVKHADSFSENCQDLLIITYEDLQGQTRVELEKVCMFLDLDLCGNDIEKAVQQSSISSMREIESRKGRKYGDSNYQFVRDGAVGNGVEAVKAEGALYDYVMKELARSSVLSNLYV